MSQRLSLSRAARLVGLKRGALQKQIRSGELPSFDGEIDVDSLLQLYPDAKLEDSTMLERVEQIMEDALCKPSEADQKRTLVSALAARIAYMGRDLSALRKQLSDQQELASRLAELAGKTDREDAAELSRLLQWYLEQSAQLNEQDDGHLQDAFLLNDTLMAFTTSHVRLLPSGHDFFVEGSESILEAGLRSGLNVNYGCNSGTCGKCKARVVSGEVKAIRPHDFRLTEAEKLQRYILTCSNTALTDVVLDAEETEDASAIPHQEIAAKVRNIDYPDEHIMALRLRTPRNERLRALGGQMARLSIGGTRPQQLYIASCPCDEANIEFHIHREHHPELWDAIQSSKPTDRVLVEGPYGEFVLRAESMRSCVFIAFGSGYSAIKSLIEHAMALDKAEQLYLLWFAGPNDGGIYMRNLCRSWHDALDNVTFEAIESELSGYPELVSGLQTFLSSHDDHRELNYYVAGDADEVDKARTVLINSRIPTRQVITSR